MRLLIPIFSVLLAIALAGIVWLLEDTHEQAQEISKMKAEMADKSVKEAFDFKRQCAAEAGRFFKYWDNDPKGNINLNYESHYNPSRKTCFVLISDRDNTNDFLDLSLFDAIEQRQYADLTSKPIGLHVLVCTLMPPDGEQKSCTSKAEFDAFVANYMESTSDLQ
jgi:hypothetical protein